MTDETMTEAELTEFNTDEAELNGEVGEPAPEEKETAAEEKAETESVIDGDIKELREEFPELSDLNSVTELTNSVRYAALRELGLSPAEAYILTSRRKIGYDNRSHLTASVPVSAKSPNCGMSSRELEEARQIFGEMPDSEIYKLYKKVNK